MTEKHAVRQWWLAPLVGVCLSAPVFADDLAIAGIWRTEPDRKNLVSHIQIAACGARYCGTVLKAFNPAGQSVQTPNIGKRLFWDMTAQPDGSLSGGTFWVPLLDLKTNQASLTPHGNTLSVIGRKGPMSAKQIWTRVK